MHPPALAAFRLVALTILLTSTTSIKRTAGQGATAMVRRKSLGRDYVAEGYFPVRVRVAVPRGGFGNQVNLIYAWLDLQVGKERYWSATASRAHNGQAGVFYFLSVADAKAVFYRFACPLRLHGERGGPSAL